MSVARVLSPLRLAPPEKNGKPSGRYQASPTQFMCCCCCLFFSFFKGFEFCVLGFFKRKDIFAFRFAVVITFTIDLNAKIMLETDVRTVSCLCSEKKRNNQTNVSISNYTTKEHIGRK